MSESRPFLDFKAIRERVGIAAVLAQYQVSLVRVNKASMKGNCPLPSHTSGSKNTFFVNQTKSVWYCHSDSCKKNGNRAGGNAIDFVALMEQCSVYAAAKRIDELFPAANTDVVQGGKRINTDATDAPKVAAPAHNMPLAFSLKDVNPSHPMIQGHGISVETAGRFGIGFFPGKGSMAGRIVFPLYEAENLVGYAGRTTLPISNGNPKWLFGKGLKKTFLYGLNLCNPAKPLILCESLWAPLWFHERGLHAASLMGSEMTEEQERCLGPFLAITVALDNDAAGIEKTDRICQRLKPKHRVSKARLVE